MRDERRRTRLSGGAVMTVLDTRDSAGTDIVSAATSRSAAAKKGLTSPWASLAALVIAVLWTIPTFGLFLSSFRPERDVQRTGWWTFFANPIREDDGQAAANLTLENYSDVLFGGSQPLAGFFVNSILVTIPAVLI